MTEQLSEISHEDAVARAKELRAESEKMVRWNHPDLATEATIDLYWHMRKYHLSVAEVFGEEKAEQKKRELVAMQMKAFNVKGPKSMEQVIHNAEARLQTGVDKDIESIEQQIERLKREKVELAHKLEQLREFKAVLDENGYEYDILVEESRVSVYALPKGTFYSSYDYVYPAGQDPSKGGSTSIWSFEQVEDIAIPYKEYKTSEEHDEAVIKKALELREKYGGVIRMEDDEHFLADKYHGKWEHLYDEESVYKAKQSTELFGRRIG